MQDGFDTETRQSFQPQLFGLVEQFRIAEGGVILIVIVDTEQGKDLIDYINPLRRCIDISMGISASWLSVSWPSFCR